MVQMLKVFCIQDHTKVFRSYGGKCLKHTLIYFFVLNAMKLTYVIYIYINKFPIKNGINTTSVFFMQTHTKAFRLHEINF